MALSYIQYPADGVTDTFNIPFPYISKSHIQVKVNGVLDAAVTFPTAYTVKTSTIPANGAIVDVRRVTPNTSRLVDFADGSLLGEGDLDTSALQNFYVMQELNDNLSGKLSLDTDNQWNAENKVIKNVANGVQPNDAVNVSQTTGIVTQAQAAQLAAEAAQDLAETARSVAELARDEAVQAKDDAQIYAASINMPSPIGNGLKFPRQKATQNGFEYRSASEVLSDINAQVNRNIPSGAGYGAHYLRQKTDETGMEYRSPFQTKLDIGALGIPVRQTVLTGRVDSEGKANFLEAATGLSAKVAGGAAPIYLSFADGFYDTGAIDYLGKIGYDDFVGGLKPNQVNYVYGELNLGSGTVGLGSTIVPPIYSPVLDTTKHALLHFEGSNGSTTMTDDYGNAWTANGTAQLTTGDKKFGNSSLYLDGTSGYLTCNKLEISGERWTIDFWVKFNSTAIKNILNTNFGILLTYDTSKLRLWLGDGISSWTIASAVFGASTLNPGQWYHIALDYDGSNYRLYVNGNVDLTIANSNYIGMSTPLALGATTSGASPINAWFDEFRVTVGAARYAGAFTPAVSPYTPDVFWFDTINYKMLYGSPTGWQYKQVVFLGEAVTNATNVTSTVTYALRGYYHTLQQTLAAGQVTLKNHNIGTTAVTPTVYYECLKPGTNFLPGDRVFSPMKGYASSSYGDLITIDNRNRLTHVMGSYSSMGVVLQKNNGVASSVVFSSWRVGIIVRRDF